MYMHRHMHRHQYVDSVDVVFVVGKGRRGGMGRAGVMDALLDLVFDMAEPLGLWQSIENVGIACWQNFKSLAELKLS